MRKLLDFCVDVVCFGVVGAILDSVSLKPNDWESWVVLISMIVFGTYSYIRGMVQGRKNIENVNSMANKNVLVFGNPGKGRVKYYYEENTEEREGSCYEQTASQETLK